ncbi:hypothetical protein NDQ71_13465 [Pseudoalteromonas sp. KG3]|uniref:hypothetical protein n=1 Tax=Pseudoalteromonas TaxID=53246 RepID=UPI0026592717|nr:hypothetical protein [Pseudoalteromonas sp. KG3]WKD22648.1 hypothetical protein NDQ71_13465 [Pseudoalteromonas sp. KG3]
MNRFRLHLTDSHERETDSRSNSFLDRNELEPKDGSVPFLDVRNAALSSEQHQHLT